MSPVQFVILIVSLPCAVIFGGLVALSILGRRDRKRSEQLRERRQAISEPPEPRDADPPLGRSIPADWDGPGDLGRTLYLDRAGDRCRAVPFSRLTRHEP